MAHADSLASPVPAARPRRRISRRLLHWTRRLHLYSGLFLLPWVLLYGVTAFLFNHPEAFAEQASVPFGPEHLAGTPLERLPPASAVAEQVVAALRARHGDDFRLVQPERAAYARDLVLVQARGGGQEHSVTLDLLGKSGRVRSRAEGTPETPAPFAVKSGVTVEAAVAERIKESMPEILERLGLGADEVTIPGLMPEVVFYMEADGAVWRVAYQPQRGSVAGRPADAPSDLSLRRYLVRLHLAHGYPSAGWTRWVWALIVDAVFVALVFWAGSGVLMWLQLRGVRRWGLLALTSGLAAAALLGAGMYRVLVP